MEGVGHIADWREINCVKGVGHMCEGCGAYCGLAGIYMRAPSTIIIPMLTSCPTPPHLDERVICRDKGGVLVDEVSVLGAPGATKVLDLGPGEGAAEGLRDYKNNQRTPPLPCIG